MFSFFPLYVPQTPRLFLKTIKHPAAVRCARSLSSVAGSAGGVTWTSANSMGAPGGSRGPAAERSGCLSRPWWCRDPRAPPLLPGGGNGRSRRLHTHCLLVEHAGPPLFPRRRQLGRAGSHLPAPAALLHSPASLNTERLAITPLTPPLLPATAEVSHPRCSGSVTQGGGRGVTSSRGAGGQGPEVMEV